MCVNVVIFNGDIIFKLCTQEPPTFQIFEDHMVGSPVGNLSTTDADEGLNAQTYYFITGMCVM